VVGTNTGALNTSPTRLAMDGKLVAALVASTYAGKGIRSPFRDLIPSRGDRLLSSVTSGRPLCFLGDSGGYSGGWRRGL
jgi:hypothetical protein